MDDKLRMSKKLVQSKYEILKKSKKIELSSLKELLSHCNTFPDLIEQYLIILKKEDKKEFHNSLMFFYPILSVKTCSIFNVKKTISEKQRFFKLIDSFLAINKESLSELLKKEIHNCDEIKQLIQIDDNNDSEINFSRWFNCYNTPINYKNEENEEYLFYSLSNCLISEFSKNTLCFKSRMNLIKNIIKLFKEIEPKRKEKKFCDYFEFLCISIISCENYDINIVGSIGLIIKTIFQENMYEFMNLKEIKSYLNENKYDFKIENKTINIYFNNETYTIKDYSKYNLNKILIDSIKIVDHIFYQEILKMNIKFSELINKAYYFNGLLINILKKYSKSNLAITSIEKLFKIEKKEYIELFYEISDNIENYITFISYNCLLDTERTIKNPIKILIDPIKEKFVLNGLEMDKELFLILKDFSNIVFRKFAFEHEMYHLVTALLFFLYINDERNLNSLDKEISDDGEINIYNNDDLENLNIEKKKNIINEAGNLFEILCYGKVQQKFTLKQLLFIANEENDNLNYIEFKKKYQHQENINLDEALDKFPDNQILSEYVKKINEGLKQIKISKKMTIEELFRNKIIVQKDDNYDDDKKDIYLLLENENNCLIEEIYRYDNHLIYEKGPNYYSKKIKK